VCVCVCVCVCVETNLNNEKREDITRFMESSLIPTNVNPVDIKIKKPTIKINTILES